jgi:hypothetical protein
MPNNLCTAINTSCQISHIPGNCPSTRVRDVHNIDFALHNPRHDRFTDLTNVDWLQCNPKRDSVAGSWRDRFELRNSLEVIKVFRGRKDWLFVSKHATILQVHPRSIPDHYDMEFFVVDRWQQQIRTLLPAFISQVRPARVHQDIPRTVANIHWIA